MCAHMYEYVRVCMHVLAYIGVCACWCFAGVQVGGCVCTCVCVHFCVYVSLDVYIFCLKPNIALLFY